MVIFLYNLDIFVWIQHFLSPPLRHLISEPSYDEPSYNEPSSSYNEPAYNEPSYEEVLVYFYVKVSF